MVECNVERVPPDMSGTYLCMVENNMERTPLSGMHLCVRRCVRRNPPYMTCPEYSRRWCQEVEITIDVSGIFT